MAFGETKQSSITAAGLCAWACCSSITSNLTAISGSTSISAFSPLVAASLPTISLKPSARHSSSSAKKAWHAWRQESRAGFARRGMLQHVPPEELDEYFAGLSPLIHAGATGLLFSHIGPESRRMSLKTWAHDFDRLHATAKGHGMRGSFMELRATGGA